MIFDNLVISIQVITLLWVEMCPHHQIHVLKSYPKNLRIRCFLKIGSLQMKYIKMRSDCSRLGPLIQKDRCLYKKRNCRHRVREAHRKNALLASLCCLMSVGGGAGRMFPSLSCHICLVALAGHMGSHFVSGQVLSFSTRSCSYASSVLPVMWAHRSN